MSANGTRVGEFAERSCRFANFNPSRLARQRARAQPSGWGGACDAIDPMKLNEFMTTEVEVIAPDSSITEAAKKMRLLNIGSLPVCDGKRLLGMITDRDITIRATADGLAPNETKVRDCMSPELVYCFDDQTDNEAEQLMQQKQIRRLPVLNREKDLVGIVALGDLALRTHQPSDVGETMRMISTPSAIR